MPTKTKTSLAIPDDDIHDIIKQILEQFGLDEVLTIVKQIDTVQRLVTLLGGDEVIAMVKIFTRENPL